jgi:hypothetical protein
MCFLCEKEVENLNKFYWGFFNTAYEPEKWIYICDECQLKFIKASNVYNFNRTPLIEMEKTIKKKVRKRND